MCSAVQTQLWKKKKNVFLILIEEPPCHIPSPEHPAGSKVMNSPTDSLPVCWLIAWPLAQTELSYLSCRAWTQARSFLYILFWPSGPSSLSEWAKESTAYPPFKVQIKDFPWIQETFHDPSQLLLTFPGLGSIITAFGEAFPDHPLYGASLPQLLKHHPVRLLPRTYHNMNSCWLCVRVCVALFFVLPTKTVCSTRTVTSQPPRLLPVVSTKPETLQVINT